MMRKKPNAMFPINFAEAILKDLHNDTMAILIQSDNITPTWSITAPAITFGMNVTSDITILVMVSMPKVSAANVKNIKPVSD